MIMKNPRRQIFPFRWPIMKYISKNPKVWKKLIKTCKYFFVKYPVYPVEKLTNFNGRWNADIRKTKTTQNVSNLWIFDLFICVYHSGGPNNVSKFMSKIVKCELLYLHFSDQALPWEEYQKLTSSGSLKNLYFCNCSFKYSDGSDVTFDKLLKNLQNIENFTLYCKSGLKMFEKDTVKKMVQILSGFKKLRRFCLTNLNENFDLSSFVDFLMKNQTIFVDLFYSNDFQFSAAYKELLETCFEQLLINPPKNLFISIHGYNGLHYQEYCKIRDSRN